MEEAEGEIQIPPKTNAGYCKANLQSKKPQQQEEQYGPPTDEPKSSTGFVASTDTSKSSTLAEARIHEPQPSTSFAAPQTQAERAKWYWHRKKQQQNTEPNTAAASVAPR